jgi:cation diffusion facilitator family transporter
MAAGVVGFLGNEAVAAYKIRVGRRIGSLALESDGHHSRADGLTSVGVVAAGAGALLGFGSLDAIVGLVVAGVIGWSAYVMGREALVRLLDGSDPRLAGRLLLEAQVASGVEHVNDVRVRHSGRTVHVVLSICVEATSSLGAAHATAEALERRLMAVLPPGSAVDIHIDPYTPEDVHERVHHAGAVGV